MQHYKIKLYWGLLSQAGKRFAREEEVPLDYQYGDNGEVALHVVKCQEGCCVGTSFESLFAGVSGWNRDLKQKVGVSQPTVLRTRNSHMGIIDHCNWLVGKNAIGVREKVVVGTLHKL